MNNAELETHARASSVCWACGDKKAEGLLICWHCFKYTKDFTPYKQSRLEFSEWLTTTTRQIPREDL